MMWPISIPVSSRVIIASQTINVVGRSALVKICSPLTDRARNDLKCVEGP